MNISRTLTRVSSAPAANAAANAARLTRIPARGFSNSRCARADANTEKLENLSLVFAGCIGYIAEPTVKEQCKKALSQYKSNNQE